MNKSRALFLDRDGVVNVDSHYVHRPEDFEFMDGIFELCRIGQEQGYTPVIITNQAGIGRGYYSEVDFHALTTWMLARFSEEDVQIGGVYYCPFHPEHGLGQYRRESDCRKPNPGMILQAQQELGMDLASSILVGDKESDIEAAMRAGVGMNILIGRQALAAPSQANLRLSTVREAAHWIQSQAVHSSTVKHLKEGA